MTQKNFIQILLLIMGVIVIGFMAVIGYRAVKYKTPNYETPKVVEKAEQLTSREGLEEAQRKIEEERAKRKALEAQLRFERQITQEEIAKLQLERQETEGRWIEAETKRAIEELFRIGHLLQDYYTIVREGRGLGQEWWLHGYQEEVNFASYLAKHGIVTAYWPEYESIYHELTGRHSYHDAKEILDNIVFLPYTAGVDYYKDSDFEKIRKILDFFHFHIHYEHDMNQILRAPAETLGFKSGDCDDWSILASAAFATAGIDSAIIFVTNIDGTGAHAMVLVQSEDTLPLWYYPDLTDFGLPSGKWWIIEPQFTLEQHQENPEYFFQWEFEVVALVESPY